MRVAIHQPNFWPHLPYFLKMAQVDLFVILRHCQRENNGYQNRFQYNGKWQTLSVAHDGLKMIADARYANPEQDWKQIKQRLPQFPWLKEFDPLIGSRLIHTNTAIILEIAKRLKIPTQIELDHETGCTATERLVKLCQHFGATTYLAGRSAHKYMDFSMFEQGGIKVEIQEVKTEDQVSVLDKL